MKQSFQKYIYSALGVLLVLSFAFGSYHYRKAEKLEIMVENDYNRAFHELVNYVDDIEVLLHKGMLVSSPSQMATISSELFRQTSAAKACLGQLPLSEVQMENTEKFLSQIGDYTYLLSQNSINNEQVSQEDYKNLASLGEYAQKLNQELLKMEDEIYAGTLRFDALSKKSNASVAYAASDYLSGFQSVEKEFQEYPSLIYDGPFSEHIESMNPLMTENAPMVSGEEALKKARDFLGIPELSQNGESQNTVLDSYSFTASYDGRDVIAAFTKKGAYPLYFLINREIGEETIPVENAISIAAEYLKTHGFSSMTESYYDKSGGIATINFAYVQDDVICYSDLIKVRIAMDTGEVVGFESKGYLMTHTQRKLPAIKLSEAEAREKINSHLSVDSVRLALIPKDSKREVLCYECKGHFSDRNYLIYINAENGREEKILMLLESPEGILTI